jgi:MFS family permease
MAIVFVNNAYLTFAPTFIQQRFGVSHFDASFYGMSMHFIAAFIGVMGGAFLSDALVRRWPRFRVLMQTTVMFLGAPMVFLIGYVDSVQVLWVVLFLFGLFRGLYESNTYAAIYDVVPPKIRAMVVGLMILSAFVIGSFAPTFFGYMGTLYEAAGLARSDGFALAFQLTSLFWLLGGFCVLLALLFTFKKDRLKD